MATVKAGEVEAVLKGPDLPPVLLVYGPDHGLVAERARRAAETFVADPADAFQLVRIDGDALSGEPGRLVEEATTIALFGGRRAIWVRPTSRNIANAAIAVLQADLTDTRVVFEAGDLAKSSPLRTACERHARALALPCYADTGRALADLIDQVMAEAGLAIDRDVRAVLLDNLGGDRLASRGELQKLALYCHGRGSVTLEDVDAVLSDVSALALDSAVDAAFAGDRQRLDADLSRLFAEGTQPAALLAAALRHGLSLRGILQAVEGGSDRRSAVEAATRGFFRRRDAMEAQLSRWRSTALDDAIDALQAAILATRRRPELAAPLAERALFDVAIAARSRARAS